MIKKLIFLFKSHTRIIVILLFLIQKIKNILVKKKVKLYKKQYLKLISNKKISSDFFSSNAYNFYVNLSKLPDNFRYLEIGSFEGGSAIFVSNKFKNSEIYCVDNWIKTDDGYSDLNFLNVELNFDFNIKNYKNIKKIKLSSNEFFNKKNKNFDVVYIDGNHFADQVFKDCLNSWKILNSNGIMICDDYIWYHHKKIKDNPCFAINKFLETIENYKVLMVSNSQIFLKKF